MTVTWPALLTVLTAVCWARSAATFNHEGIIVSMVLGIIAATLWLTYLLI